LKKSNKSDIAHSISKPSCHSERSEEPTQHPFFECSPEVNILQVLHFVQNDNLIWSCLCFKVIKNLSPSTNYAVSPSPESTGFCSY
jgi:hypothetical protein